MQQQVGVTFDLLPNVSELPFVCHVMICTSQYINHRSPTFGQLCKKKDLWERDRQKEHFECKFNGFDLRLSGIMRKRLTEADKNKN